jgi:hypothetical protein
MGDVPGNGAFFFSLTRSMRNVKTIADDSQSKRSQSGRVVGEHQVQGIFDGIEIFATSDAIPRLKGPEKSWVTALVSEQGWG